MKLILQTVIALALLLATGSRGGAQQSPEYDTDDLVARGLFEAGRAAYDAGNYNDALGYFQQAYDHSKRPRLLYNVGQSADRLRMNRTALNAFRKYLELVPDAENRREVENRIRALEMFVIEDEGAQQPTSSVVTALPQVQQPREATPARPQAAPLTVEAPRASGPSIAPWFVVGTGAAITITGVVLFATGESRISNVEDAPMRSAWSTVRDDADSGPAYRDAGIATLAVGVLAVAAGVTWIVVASSDDGEVVTAHLGPSGLLLRGSL